MDNENNKPVTVQVTQNNFLILFLLYPLVFHNPLLLCKKFNLMVNSS